MKKLIILLVVAQIAYSEEIYQYEDTKGNLVITNKPTPSAQKMDLPPLNVLPKPMTRKDLIENNSQNNLGTNEVGRQKILQEELAKEKIALSDSQQLIQENKDVKIAQDTKSKEASQVRSKILNEAVIEHQKNIEILNKQLGN